MKPRSPDELAETALGQGSAASPSMLGETITSLSAMDGDTIPAEAKIGRFVVLHKLGRGGMGVVYAATDPRLERKVAIKMLHDGLAADHTERLEREARAMAQLAHPNVLTVHETGSFEGRLYIVMEHVDGQTFAGWLRTPRTHDQIVELMLQAGRGLAAAHAVGLVHRDFKPDNILVGNDGRARVSDFGLVTAAGEALAVDGLASPAVLSPSALTITGTVMGTPLYMAPEQHGGRTADAKADQFSFCVTLWQALCDEAPYGADTYEELVKNVVGGKLRPIPREARVSAKLRAILERGLRADPEKRFPSMQALLVALERTRWRSRARPLAIGGAVLAAGTGVVLVLALRGPATDPCAGAAQRLVGVWDEARRTGLAAVFDRTGLPTASDNWKQIARNLDRYTTSWIAHHEDVCRATHVRGEQSAELLDLRMHCLDGRLADVDRLLGRFAETTDRNAMYKALDASSTLGGFGDCDDAARLHAAIPMPDDPLLRAKITELEQRLADATSLDKLGRFGPALAIVTPLAIEAHQLGYAPLEAKAVLLRAGEEYRSGDLAAAEQSYRDAADAAARARDDGRLAQSWIDLMNLLAARGRYADALALVAMARTSAERVSDQPRLGARFHNVLAGIHLAQARYPDAKAEYDRALELVKLDGPDSDLLGPALLNLGTVLSYVGDSDGAMQRITSAQARFVAMLGPRHPTLGYVHRNLGDLVLRKGDLDGAIAHYVDAVKIFEDAQGDDHVDVAIALEPLSYAYARKGDLAHARQTAERALVLREHKLGPDHPSLALPLSYLADVDATEGTPASLGHALDRLTRALALQEKAFGVEAAQLPSTLDQLGDVALKLGQLDAAIAHRQRSLAIRAKLLGARHNDTAYAQLRLAEVEVAANHLADALRDYGFAEAIFRANDPTDPDIARMIAREADVRSRQHRDADALALYVKALAANSPPPLRAAIELGHARALWQAGKHPEAIAVARAAEPAADAAVKAELAAWLGGK